MPEKDRFSRRFKERARTHFLTGLLVIVPLAATYYVVSSIVQQMDRVLAILPEKYHPDTYLPFPVPGLGLIFTLIIIQLVGMLGANLMGRNIVRMYELLLHRIPFVRGLYLALKQLSEQVFVADAGRFRRVVLVHYPTPGTCRVGFVTGERPSPVVGGRRLVHVFIPNTPNAATGLFFLAAEEDLTPLNLTVDQAFKLIMSAGLVGGEGAARPPADTEPGPAPSEAGPPG